MTPLNYQHLESPIGTLRLLSDGQALVRIEFENHLQEDGDQRCDAVREKTAAQLQQYFAGERRHFELPLAPGGTDFQQGVWNQLRAIPFGELRTYRDVAVSVGNLKAVRAVGVANGRNPIPIVVPCHRVVGSNGKLTGFAGGLNVKRKLLALEGLELSE